MKTRNRLLLNLMTAAVVTAAAERPLRADTFAWDPDGAGLSPALIMNTFQFGAGNSLFQGAIPFTAMTTFQLMFHAQLNSVVTNLGAQQTPTGLNASTAVGGVAPFEITIVGSVTESVTNVNNTPARVVYRVAGNQAANSFVELYFDGTADANPLQGTGYNDGTLILRGVPNPPAADVGSFNLSNPQPAAAPNFDLFANNDYSTSGTGNTNIISLSGIGATKMDVTVTFVEIGRASCREKC